MDAQSTGFVVWITGMSRAGKTALADHLARRLNFAARPVEVLDEANGVLMGGLGSSKEERDTACRRLGLVAKMLARNGIVAVCASLSPYREMRETLRRDLRRFVEVFVDCPMPALQQRDASGLYEKALKGEVKNVAGIDDPYEPPAHAEVVVHSDQETVEQESLRICQALVDLKLLGPAEFVRLSGGQRPKRNKPARVARKGAHGKLAAKAAARKVPKKIAARTTKPARRARR